MSGACPPWSLPIPDADVFESLAELNLLSPQAGTGAACGVRFARCRRRRGVPAGGRRRGGARRRHPPHAGARAGPSCVGGREWERQRAARSALCPGGAAAVRRTGAVADLHRCWHAVLLCCCRRSLFETVSTAVSQQSGVVRRPCEPPPQCLHPAASNAGVDESAADVSKHTRGAWDWEFLI